MGGRLVPADCGAYGDPRGRARARARTQHDRSAHGDGAVCAAWRGPLPADISRSPQHARGLSVGGSMATSITGDEFLASLTKWGLNWRFYKDKADWLTHNRNGTSRNQAATPGGFG